MLVAIFPVFLSAPLAQAELSETDEKVAYDVVTGTVGSVSKQAISVEYSRTKTGSYEMLLPLTEETRLEHLKSLDELKTGDTIRARYQQTYREGDKGERIILKTAATEIALIRRAPEQALSSREEPSE